MRFVGRRSQRLDRPGTADRGGGGVGDLPEGAAPDPLRDDQSAAVVVLGDVEDTGQPGSLDTAQDQCARQDCVHLFVGHGAVRVNEGERDLTVQRDIQRLPELQPRGAAVEHQQAVATVGDRGTGAQGAIRARLVPPGGAWTGGHIRLEVAGRLAGHLPGRPVGPVG